MNPTVLNKSRYNKYQNKYNFLLKVARKKYFHDKLISVSTDLRKTWSVIISRLLLKRNLITISVTLKIVQASVQTLYT